MAEEDVRLTQLFTSSPTATANLLPQAFNRFLLGGWKKGKEDCIGSARIFALSRMDKKGLACSRRESNVWVRETHYPYLLKGCQIWSKFRDLLVPLAIHHCGLASVAGSRIFEKHMIWNFFMCRTLADPITQSSSKSHSWHLTELRRKKQ